MITFGSFLTTAQFPGWTQGDALDATLAYAREAERLGYARVWLTEHHFIPIGACSSSLAMAGFLLGRTGRPRVGTAICPLPLYHPLHLAQQAALLDQLSGGRLDFGVGKGGFRPDLEAFGLADDALTPRLEQGLEVLLGAWRDEQAAGAGPCWTFPPIPVYPCPHTRPSTSPASRRRRWRWRHGTACRC